MLRQASPAGPCGRPFISVLGAASIFALTMPASAQDLTISVWGGTYAEEFEATVVEPFEEAEGVEVALETGLSSERLAKLLATRGAGVDLFYITDHQMVEAQNAGLLQPVDAANIPNLDELYEFARDPLGDGMCPAFTVLGVGLAYNKDQIEEPLSWTDLWAQDLPGSSGWADMSVSYSPLLLVKTAELQGGGIDNVDPAFELLSDIKDRLRIFQRREILNGINDGSVTLAPHLNIFVPQDESVPLRFGWPEEGGLGVLNLACVLESSDNPELAQKFINHHLSAEMQRQMLLEQGESPVNSTVEVPDDLDFNVIGAEQVESLNFWDPAAIVANREDWLSRWQEEVIAQ